MKLIVRALSCLLIVAFAGCALLEPSKPEPPPAPPAKKASAPRYNLTGYSPAFKEGYGDACATPRKRSEKRFKDDADYRIGWQDGSSVCRSR